MKLIGLLYKTFLLCTCMTVKGRKSDDDREDGGETEAERATEKRRDRARVR